MSRTIYSQHARHWWTSHQRLPLLNAYRPEIGEFNYYNLFKFAVSNVKNMWLANNLKYSTYLYVILSFEINKTPLLMLCKLIRVLKIIFFFKRWYYSKLKRCHLQLIWPRYANKICDLELIKQFAMQGLALHVISPYTKSALKFVNK